MQHWRASRCFCARPQILAWVLTAVAHAMQAHEIIAKRKEELAAARIQKRHNEEYEVGAWQTAAALLVHRLHTHASDISTLWYAQAVPMQWPPRWAVTDRFQYCLRQPGAEATPAQCR